MLLRVGHYRIASTRLLNRFFLFKHFEKSIAVKIFIQNHRKKKKERKIDQIDWWLATIHICLRGFVCFNSNIPQLIAYDDFLLRIAFAHFSIADCFILRRCCSTSTHKSSEILKQVNLLVCTRTHSHMPDRSTGTVFIFLLLFISLL